MSAAWVAGGVRARAASSRRLGAAGARTLAGSGDLETAIARLSKGPYGHDVRPGQSLAQAQHAIAATLLWHLRVLAGWLPREGVSVMRVLAGWAELANIEGLLRSLRRAEEGATGPGDAQRAVPAFVLGSLATAWPQVRGARDRAAVRAALATSVWGDPGADDDRTVTEVLRLTWAARVAASVPSAETWARGAAALLVAHDLAERRELGGPTPTAAARAATARALGARATDAESLEQLRATLGRRSRWALDDARDLADLWSCEAAWWRRVQRDAAVLTTTSRLDAGAVVGVVASLAVDAWRTRAALGVAARREPAEVLDAVL